MSPTANWAFTGRFAAYSESEAWNGDVYWEQESDHYQILLSGPLGQGKVRLSGNATHSELQTAEDQIRRSFDAQSLLFEFTGVVIPVDGLRYWLTGTVAPNGDGAITERDELGRFSRIQQLGWDVSIKRYIQVNGFQLPDKLYLHNRDYTVRVVVDQWAIKT